MQDMSWSDHLKQTFGIEEFRAEQSLTLEKIAAGESALLLLPTGGGKSLIYQFIASFYEELVVVVSPLIALMDDQVREAKKFGISAARIHSGLDLEQKQKFLRELENDRFRLIFVTPERFGKAGFREVIAKKKVRLLAVDEAHSLSQWGHDLRPDYKKLPQIREILGNPPAVAMTATATEPVRTDIAGLLQIPRKNWIIASFYREELQFSVAEAFGFDEKMKRLIAAISAGAPTIIYGSLIASLQRIGLELERKDIPYLKYHGDLPAHVRRAQQKLFLEGSREVMLATPAFGLGIHKADVRHVIHFEIPQHLEGYFQEAGRAGRDRGAARATLIYDEEDVTIQMDFIRTSHPKRDFLKYALELVRENSGATLDHFHEKAGGRRREFRLDTSLRLLQSLGAIDFRGSQVFLTEEEFDESLLPSTADVEAHEKHQMQKLLSMVRWASEESECRYKVILNYFSESFEGRCGACDVCRKTVS